MSDGTADATGILRAACDGDVAAADRLAPLVYEQLRRVARGQLAHERADHTLDPTALVHEAYLKLIDQTRADVRDRAHFVAIAATAMRRILVDHARAKGAAKRGGDRERVPLDRAIDPDGTVNDYAVLDEALERLASEEQRAARVVELRHFGGLSIEQTASPPGRLRGDGRARLAVRRRGCSKRSTVMGAQRAESPRHGDGPTGEHPGDAPRSRRRSPAHHRSASASVRAPRQRSPALAASATRRRGEISRSTISGR